MCLSMETVKCYYKNRCLGNKYESIKNDKYVFEGLIYPYNENDKSLLLIHNDYKKNKPLFVIKYYGLNENSLSALTSRCFNAFHH